MSHDESERSLKKQANDNSYNYQTFTRYFPLKYETLGGAVARQVNTSMCHVVCLDNLVKLTAASDPDEHHSVHSWSLSQVCQEMQRSQMPGMTPSFV